VIDREIIVPVDSLTVAAEVTGTSLPHLIEPEPRWRDRNEQLVFRAHAWEALGVEGLCRGENLTEEFARTLAVLGYSSKEFSALVQSAKTRYRLHVAASGQSAVFACYVPASGQVLLRPARPAALAEDLVRELPDFVAAQGPALSVPESDLRRAMDGGPARRDVRRVMDVAALPREGGGQIYAGLRDGRGSRRTTRDNTCTFYDTEHGRYLFSFTEQPGYGRYVNVSQGRPEMLVGKAYEMLASLG
jgi:hypothetical protein